MKRFKFSLEGVLGYKLHLLNAEKETLRRLCAKREEMIRRCQELESAERLCILDYERKCSRGISAARMAALHGGLRALRVQIEQQRQAIDSVQAEINRQTGKVVGLSREKTSMEKLKARQLARYRYLEEKENERYIEDFIQNQRFSGMTG